MKFTEETIKELFGPEAAEDESANRLKEYYFKGDVYEKIHNQLPLKILVGHKGIGKSAAFKISYLENQEKNNVTVWIRPDDIMELCNDDVNFLKQIRDWKIGLSSIITNKVLENVGLSEDMNKKDYAINKEKQNFHSARKSKKVFVFDTVRLTIFFLYDNIEPNKRTSVRQPKKVDRLARTSVRYHNERMFA